MLRNGRVITVDDQFSVADALAVSGKRIAAVGGTGIDELIGPNTQVIDLDGRSVLPGINDAHLHLAMFGESLRSVGLGHVDSLAALERALAEGIPSLTGGQWLIGEGWREAAIAEFHAGTQPHRAQLDPVTGARPAVLHHASRHSSLVNTAALRVAGIDRETPDPVGGRIVRDAAGEPTGLLLESAGILVGRHIPQQDEQARLDAIIAAMRKLNSLGITSVTDPVVLPELLRDYGTLHRRGELSVRVNTLLHWDWPSPSTSLDGIRTALRYSGVSTGLGDEWLRIGGVKLFADGVPSHSTAWLHQPYPCGGHGSLLTSGEDDQARCAQLWDIIETIHRHRLQVQIHVTGDRAADAAIEGILRAQARDPWPQARHALIHGTLLSEAALPVLAEHGIGVITSSLMKGSAGPGMSAAIGEDRWARAFPAGALEAAGVLTADSSDAPVTYPDWRRGLATFLGAAPSPLAELAPGQRLTFEQAIRLWTTAGAYLEHAEHRKGALRPGLLADLVVLDGDILTADPVEIPELAIVLTVAGGRPVFTADLVAGNSRESGHAT